MSNCCADGACPECVERRRAYDEAQRGAAALATAAAPAPRKRFFAFGHRMPLEMGLLALGKNRDARAGLVAITARRIGHINDLQLRLHLVAIFVYGKASDVVLELVGLEAERERRMRARAAA